MKHFTIILLFFYKVESAIEYMSCQKIKDLGMCYDKSNRHIICNSCFTTCGFENSNYCDENILIKSTKECVDKMDCSSYTHLCNVPALKDSLKGVCDKTCNYCDDGTTLSPSTSNKKEKIFTTTHLIDIHRKDMCLSLRD